MMTFTGAVVILLSLSTLASKTQFDNSFVLEIFLKCYTYPKVFLHAQWVHGNMVTAIWLMEVRNAFHTHLKNIFAAAPSTIF